MNALIVDDELGIVEMIKNITPWSNLGIRRILTAFDGQTALKTIREENPDIVISDIEMPGMDGMALAETIMSESENPPEIIFLTCHAEFHYAQRAIRCGVTDYLLKPFFPEELTAVLSKAVVRRRERQNMEESESDTREYVRQSFLRDILNHVYDKDPDRLQRAARKYDIALDRGKRRSIVAVGIPIEEILQRYTRSELIFMFGNISREILCGLEDQEGLLVDNIVDNYYTGYLFLDEAHRQGIEDKCIRLGNALRQYLDVTAACVISGPVNVQQYSETKDRIDALLRRTLMDGPVVLMLEEQEAARDQQNNHINKQTVAQYLRERKKTELFLYMRHFLEQQLSSRDMKRIHQDLIQVFYGYLYENRIDTKDFMQDEVSLKVSEAAEFSAINMMKYVSFLYDSVVRHIEELKKSRSVIERAKQYIAEHYMEDIGRTVIAQEVMLAPNYLSMLFHKETGQTIREYINLCRVEEAKKIMAFTNDSITDVAMQVGFDNISYFSTVFKKYTNSSPAEYRSTLRKEREKTP
ncbi:MAG: response regulator [Firmicutes bacterium]|nr:response regulator [Bacillota bacterium]